MPSNPRRMTLLSSRVYRDSLLLRPLGDYERRATRLRWCDPDACEISRRMEGPKFHGGVTPRDPRLVRGLPLRRHAPWHRKSDPCTARRILVFLRRVSPPANAAPPTGRDGSSTPMVHCINLISVHIKYKYSVSRRPSNSNYCSNLLFAIGPPICGYSCCGKATKAHRRLPHVAEKAVATLML